MRKIVYFLVLTILLWWSSLAKISYDDFLATLKQNGINTTEIQQRESVSRYELARLLNASECYDCFHPSNSFVSRYTSDNWRKFIELPGKNFSDITAPETIFLDNNYFYCIAYVWDMWHMQGYSYATSPICASKFCGFRNVNRAEFYQVMLNVLDKYLYEKYTVNWQKMYAWLVNLPRDSYEYLYLNTADRSLIQEYQEQSAQQLKSAEELQTYSKYCLFNLSTCGFAPINDIPQWFWPLSQMNILLKNGIIADGGLTRSSLFTNVSGKEILQALYKSSDLTSCSFNNDYDRDKIPNTEDNCPNHFNPHQRDLDGDGIGDVCDDDIDGDGIKNPIGIVDDSGKIDITKLKDTEDNCIFTINPWQQRTQDDFYGDACQGIGDRLGVTIVVKEIGYYAPMDATFFAQIEGKWDTVEREFGDWGNGVWQTISHTFMHPWVYTVKVKVKNRTHTATSSTTVVVWENPDVQIAVEWIDTRLIYAEKCISSVLKKVGVIDRIQVDFDGKIVEYDKDTRVMKYCFDDSGAKNITITLLKWDKKVSISRLVIGIGEGTPAANLLADTLTPQLGEITTFRTKIAGFTPSDIKSIVWDFGDGVKKRNTALTMAHRYTQPWAHLVQQEITLYSWEKIHTAVTIYVVDPQSFKSYYLYQYLKKLFWKVGDTVTIFYKKSWNQQEIGAKVNNGNWEKNLPKLPSTVSDTYSAGKYLPFSELYFSGNIILTAHSTFRVDGKGRCEDALLTNTLWKFHCDMDKDGIPDVCDTDIDGDGFPNLLNIIKTEPKDCKYTIDDLDKEVFDSHNNYPVGLDNCFLIANKDQKDSDGDWRGDVCDDILDTNDKNADRDGDGIRDAIDECPDLPENYNNNRDRDGCPEIPDWEGNDDGNDDGNDTEIITPAECYSCPCNYADFSWDLSEKDKIKAEIKSLDKKSLYDVSPSVYMSDFL